MKIKLSKSQWEQIGKTCGWLKTAGGWGRFSEELSDCIEGKCLVGIQTNKKENEIFNEIKQDSGLSQMMAEEEMTDNELRQCIAENTRMYTYLNRSR